MPTYAPQAAFSVLPLNPPTNSSTRSGLLNPDRGQGQGFESGRVEEESPSLTLPIPREVAPKVRLLSQWTRRGQKHPPWG